MSSLQGRLLALTRSHGPHSETFEGGHGIDRRLEVLPQPQAGITRVSSEVSMKAKDRPASHEALFSQLRVSPCAPADTTYTSLRYRSREKRSRIAWSPSELPSPRWTTLLPGTRSRTLCLVTETRPGMSELAGPVRST